jgi:hypothetical protein
LLLNAVSFIHLSSIKASFAGPVSNPPPSEDMSRTIMPEKKSHEKTMTNLSTLILWMPVMFGFSVSVPEHHRERNRIEKSNIHK